MAPLMLFARCKPALWACRPFLHVTARRPLAHPRAEGSSTEKEKEGQQGEPPKDVQLPEWVVAAIRQYDANIVEARDAVREQQLEVEKFDMRIQELEMGGAPRWILGILGWLRNLLAKLVNVLQEKERSMEAGRDSYVKELASLAADEAVAEGQKGEGAAKSIVEGLNEEQRRTLETPEALAGQLIFQALASATVITVIGSLLGAHAGRLLGSPLVGWSAEELSTWGAWSAPYVGATLLACMLTPGLMTKRVLRWSNVSPSYFAELGPFTSLALATAMAGSQVVVYQGLWLDAGLSFYRGSAGALPTTDPALLEESLRNSMGSLVAPSAGSLTAFLAAPLALLGTAVLEAGWWALGHRVDELLSGSSPEDKEEQPDEFAVLHRRFMDDSPVSDGELGLTAARIFASSAYLSTEVLVSGSLWSAVGTSAAGLMAAMLVARQQGRALQGSDSN